MSEFSRETLLNIIETDHVQCGEASALARMALAAMDSEPVAYTDERNLGYIDRGRETAYLWGKQNSEASDVELYRHAQPVPVVPDEINSASAPEVFEIAAEAERLGLRGTYASYAVGWNACRAAMLQASPVCTCPSGDGSLRWPCPVHAGNSPVIGIGLASGQDRTVEVRYVAPPGYVTVPREPTAEMILSAMRDNETGEVAEIYELMLAAAPQSPGSEPATVPGSWIPVSEQMPSSRYEVLVGRWWGEKPRWCCKWATYIPGHPDAQSSGWFIPGASWTPTHWMPLPAAPQEVKGE
ncbi:TPA: DUF551 domain-containing protein [Klebsiella pneumoniae]